MTYEIKLCLMCGEFFTQDDFCYLCVVERLNKDVNVCMDRNGKIIFWDFAESKNTNNFKWTTIVPAIDFCRMVRAQRIEKYRL